MKIIKILSIPLLPILLNACSALNYNSRQEAISACEKWKSTNSANVFTPSGSTRSKMCNLEIEARQVIGRELKDPIPLKVYTEKNLDNEIKTVKYFRY